MPEPAVKVADALLVIPPEIDIATFAELFQVPPAATVINPVNVGVPPLITKLPEVPPPTVVVPLTVKVPPFTVKEVPSPILKLLLIVVLMFVLTLALPVVATL